MSVEDFFVEEVIQLEEAPGDYLYVKVTKQDWNTLDVVGALARQLRMPRKYIRFAGTKDKHATTTQYFSIYRGYPGALARVRLQGVHFEPLGRGKVPIVLGGLEGNKFRIRKSFSRIMQTSFLVNYFGPQRFSTNNAAVGLAIMRKDWKTACSLIERREVQDYLVHSPHNYIGALQQLDKRLLSLYVNALQAFLWNKVAAAYLRAHYPERCERDGLVFVEYYKENVMIPLMAFDMVVQDQLLKQLYQGVLEEEGLSMRDFILRSFPEVMPISVERPLFVNVQDFCYKNGWLSFFLPKGAYATILVRQLESFL